MLFNSGLEQIKSLKGGRQKEMQSCKRYAKQSVRWEVSRADGFTRYEEAAEGV